MAERRMFAKTIIDSDAFMDMPLSTQALYFHLSMRADDDGFINNPRKIQRMVGASEDDFKVLIAKRFLLPFDSGVVVIKHWKVHNYIQKDRYKPTIYVEERATLQLKENNVYTECIQTVYNMDTQVRLGKVSLGQDRLGQSECEDTPADEQTDRRQMNLIGGSLGKNVVRLTDEQWDDLLDRLGLEGFNTYVERLANYIIEKNANIRSHYATILKWYEEDNAVRG